MFINIFKSNTKVDLATVTSTSEETNATNLPKSLQVQYKPNFGTFDNWMKNNRDHQNDAFKAIQKATIGQVCLPTGTGKTRVQIATHVSKMIEMCKKNEYGTFVVGAHRLALCSQLLTELITVAVNAGIPFDILFIGSDRFSDDKVHCKFKNKGFNAYVNEATSTTRSDEVREAVEKAHSRNRHVICVSTYHSFDKLDALDSITQCTYDEAHTLVADGFMENIILVKPKINFNFFFTATRRVQGESEGMNNVEIFGEVLNEVSPRKMIEKGESVPPKLHIIQTEDEGDFQNHTMLVRTVITGYEQHKALVKCDSADADLIGAKMLITTTGNLEMFELHNDEAFKVYCQTNNIKTFAFSSQEGVFYNFEKVARSTALDEMSKMSDEEDAILIHIDILTEGIDLPSITGVMPFRELITSKLLQTIGRGARLLKSDRIALYSGELAPMDWKNYTKPCVWVILPEHFRSLGNAQAMKNTIRTIVNSYDIPVEEYNAIDRYIAIEDADLSRITARDVPNRRDSESGLIHTVEDVMMEKFNIIKMIPNPLELLTAWLAK
jgi:superfamily II DNA or RNA helicase